MWIWNDGESGLERKDAENRRCKLLMQLLDQVQVEKLQQNRLGDPRYLSSSEAD